MKRLLCIASIAIGIASAIGRSRDNCSEPLHNVTQTTVDHRSGAGPHPDFLHLHSITTSENCRTMPQESAAVTRCPPARCKTRMAASAAQDRDGAASATLGCCAGANRGAWKMTAARAHWPERTGRAVGNDLSEGKTALASGRQLRLNKSQPHRTLRAVQSGSCGTQKRQCVVHDNDKEDSE